MLKRDHYLFGVAVGILMPLSLFAVIWLINFFLLRINVVNHYLNMPAHILISIAGNLLLIRYYFVNLKFEKTGRSVLLITFILMLSFFAFNETLKNIL